MKYEIHSGLTSDPDATLPNGSAEIARAQLLKYIARPSLIADQLKFKAHRKRLLGMIGEERERFVDPLLPAFLDELSDLISERKRTQTVVAVLAPWHEDETLSKSEGYIRRIAEMDGRVLGDAFCIYFYECPYFKVDRIVVDRVREDRLYIRYNTAYRQQREFVEQLISLCDVCWSHSVLRLIPAEHPERAERWLGIFGGSVKHILDAHGAVVEEALALDDAQGAELCKKAEEIYFKNISACVVLTDAMRRYFEEKYDCKNITFFKTPVLSRDISLHKGEKLDKSGPLTAVYAGGCQKWQNIPLMQRAMRARPDVMYRIFVSEPERFTESWGDEPLPNKVTVKNGTPEEIKEAYKTAHYGFILRDDDPLNRVACPTKLMEYIQFGIVPIVKSENIGDFKKLGLHMLPVERFMKGEDSKPANENVREIFVRLSEEYQGAMREIVEWICSQVARSLEHRKIV